MKFISQLLPLQANTGELAPEKMTEKVGSRKRKPVANDKITFINESQLPRYIK